MWECTFSRWVFAPAKRTAEIRVNFGKRRFRVECERVSSAERLAFREDGMPIELTLSVMRGDRYKIVLNVTEVAG